MAGPSVMVRVLGDVSGLAKSFTDSGSKASAAAGKAHAAFSNMLGMLNQSGVLGPFGEALATADEAIQNLAEHGKHVSDVMLGAGAGLLTVGTLATSLGSKEKAAHQQLADAIANTGQSYDTYGKQIDEAVKHQEKYGNSSVETQNALQALTQATHNPAEALKLLSTASDVAAAKHEDLTTAATAVGKVYNGNTKLLKEYGIVLDKHTHLTADGKTATQALADVTAGQAAAASDTFNGKIKALSTTMEDHAAQMGAKYGPALQGVGAAMTAVGTAMKIGQAAMSAFKGAQEAATVATDTQTAAEDAAAISEGLALAPILLIVGALALLGVAAYEIYTHWKTIWADIKAAVVDVWNWIRNNWPLLLAIILGPIGVAAGLVIKHWGDIKQAAVDVWNWITSTWDKLYGYIVRPFTDAYNFITRIVGDIVNAFTGLPGKIVSALGNVSSDILHAITKAIPGGGLIGGAISKIGGLFQEGGMVPGTGPQLAVVHGGEYVLSQKDLAALTSAGGARTSALPIAAPARPGPAVHIENATFSSGVDVETFMRKAAWVVQTQKV
jgi:hypothetical protein